MDQRKGFTSLRDMFDGGGAGKFGDKFEGGGLLSMLGNALGIAPLGSREREEQLAALSKGAAGMAVNPPAPVQRAAGGASMDGAPGFRDSRQPAGVPAMSPLEMFGGQQPAPYTPMGPSMDEGIVGMAPTYSGRGAVGMPYPQFAKDQPSREVIDYLRATGLLNY